MTDCLSSTPKASGSSHPYSTSPPPNSSCIYGKQAEQQLGDGNLQVNQLLVRSRRSALYPFICKLIFIYYANFPIGNTRFIDYFFGISSHVVLSGGIDKQTKTKVIFWLVCLLDHKIQNSCLFLNLSCKLLGVFLMDTGQYA